MTQRETFSYDSLKIDCEQEAERICSVIREKMSGPFKRKGLVVAMSGGIDSSTVAGLAVRALGKERVLGLLMPEKHSSEDTLGLSRSVADRFGIETVHEDISGILESLGCYRRQNEAVKEVIPEFDDSWKFKIVLPNVIDGGTLRVFKVVAQSPAGETIEKRLPTGAYMAIVAATNFKQRVRKMLEYYHADRLNYAVTGTPNRQEYDQGFFVKLGDGAADIKPIAHLYKTQVYQMAAHLGVPEEILNRPPTTDTYSLSQGQDEFYFSLPYDKMDLCLFGLNREIPLPQVARAAELSEDQVKMVYNDIEQKRRSTAYLHLSPQLVEKVFP
ncbi:MAG: NAD(+) synthase [Spirochaetales bacterium]|nr:NAD(+) synthase [Spirochaetales bacterium]